MEPGWFVSNDPDAVLTELQKVECSKCHHYELYEPSKAQEIYNDWQNFKCPLCWHEEGILKINKFTKCGSCNQVFDDRKQRECYCLPLKPLSIKTVKKGFAGSETNPELQRIQNDIENSKTQRILADKVRKARLEPELRQQRIEKLLEKAVTLLEIKAAKEELQNVS